MSYAYDYTLGEEQPILGQSAGSIGTIVKAGLAKAAPAKDKGPSTGQKILSMAGRGLDIASSYARKQELIAEAEAKRAESQRIVAAGSNIQKYILPIAVGGVALIGIIYFARKK